MTRQEKVVQNLKEEFFADKDKFINAYRVFIEENVERYSYTSGKPVLIYRNKAYSRNGFFFAVILKDEEYVSEKAEAMGDIEDDVEEEESEYIPEEGEDE